MALVFASICPHPPIIIPAIGGSEANKCQSTIKAMEDLSGFIAQAEPETLIMISPHAMVHSDRFAVYGNPRFQGSFDHFGAPEVNFRLENDLGLAQAVVKQANQEGIGAFLFGDPDGESFELDHGIMVPLFYLAKNLPESIKIIPMAFSHLSPAQHYAFGQTIRDVINSAPFRDKKVALIASGDLSHRLAEGTLAGYSASGKEFDKQIVEDIQFNRVREILEMEEDFLDEAGECGYRSFVILLGVLDGLKYRPEVLSYEGPFGVGYMVANFNFL